MDADILDPIPQTTEAVGNTGVGETYEQEYDYTNQASNASTSIAISPDELVRRAALN